MITLLRWILLPFSLIYQFITWLRNLLYDYQIFKSKSFSIPTIVIGNLAVGGTGKSPMTEYLIRLLKSNYRIATLSRGYGRKTKGYRLVETHAMAIEVGDEPLQFKNKFSDITVAVSEDRRYGIEQLQANHDLIILDDAYQHRKLKPGFSLLLFDFKSLFEPILSLPTGNFRDNISAAKRADIIVITKCPQTIDANQKQHIEQLLIKYNKKASIYYTSITYNKVINTLNKPLEEDLKEYDVLLFTGIANPTPLENYLIQNAKHFQTIEYPDHYNYQIKDFHKILDSFNAINSSKKIIITTEKDIQRIDADIFSNYPLYYIPIHLQILFNEQDKFNQQINNYLKESR